MAAPIAGEWTTWPLSVGQDLMADGSWTLAVERASSSISHRSSPWGGMLIKVTCRAHLSEPLDGISYGLVRPEVRENAKQADAQTILKGCSLYEHIAPGDVILEMDKSGVSSIGGLLKRICSMRSALLGQENSLDDLHTAEKGSCLVRSTFIRDFPSDGDCCLTHVPYDSSLMSLFSVCRAVDASTVQMSNVIHVPGLTSVIWPSFILNMLLRKASQNTQDALDRPGIHRLREINQTYYVVLTVRCCKRGPPLLPAGGPPDAEVEVAVGEDEQAPMHRYWKTSNHANESNTEKFNLARYLSTFFSHFCASSDVSVYDSLDGRKLVSYQCAMKMEDWNSVKSEFMKAYLTQKKAYRRKHGGSTAPIFKDDVKPCFTRNASEVAFQEQSGSVALKEYDSRLVVRNTFIDVDDNTEEDFIARKRRKMTWTESASSREKFSTFSSLIR